MAKAASFYGTGRRKKSIARVYLTPGKGNITINKRNIDEYLGLASTFFTCNKLNHKLLLPCLSAFVTYYILFKN